MSPSPTGLRQSASSVSNSSGGDLAIAVASSFAVMGAGVGLVAFGATHLNPAAILPGVTLAVEGVVSLATLAAGGGSKEVAQVREGFKFTATNIVETGILKVVESVASMASTEKQGKQFANVVGAAKNVTTIVLGKTDPNAAIGAIKDTAELAMFLDERAAHLAELIEQDAAKREASEKASDGQFDQQDAEMSEPADDVSNKLVPSKVARPEGEQKFIPNY